MKCRLIFLVAVIVAGCSEGLDSAEADLQKSLSLVGQVTSIETGELRSVKERTDAVERELVFVPFRASIRLTSDMRNNVQNAREGRYQREYVGWVIQSSTSEQGRRLLEHTALLENLSSERWYEKQAGESVPIAGELRYRKEKGSHVFLGVFESHGNM